MRDDLKMVVRRALQSHGHAQRVTDRVALRECSSDRRRSEKWSDGLPQGHGILPSRNFTNQQSRRNFQLVTRFESTDQKRLTRKEIRDIQSRRTVHSGGPLLDQTIRILGYTMRENPLGENGSMDNTQHYTVQTIPNLGVLWDQTNFKVGARPFKKQKWFWDTLKSAGTGQQRTRFSGKYHLLLGLYICARWLESNNPPSDMTSLPVIVHYPM